MPQLVRRRPRPPLRPHGRPTNTFDVITQLRAHRGNATASIVLDAPRNTGVTLDLDELDRVISMLTNERNHLVRTTRETS